MYALKAIVKWGWCPILITVLAIVSHVYEWPIEAVIPILVVILVIGLVVTVIRAKEKELEQASLKLKQLSGYFNRQFMGESSLSIFVIIKTLFNVDDPKLWDWARACDMSQRIFNTWCDSFISRLESDIRTKKYNVFLHTYLNELWQINNHYYEFVDDFHKVAENVEIPQYTIDQYNNRFVIEYNAFVQNFQDTISDLRKAARTEIEPPSIKLAKSLSGVKLT